MHAAYSLTVLQSYLIPQTHHTPNAYAANGRSRPIRRSDVGPGGSGADRARYSTTGRISCRSSSRPRSCRSSSSRRRPPPTKDLPLLESSKSPRCRAATGGGRGRTHTHTISTRGAGETRGFCTGKPLRGPPSPLARASRSRRDPCRELHLHLPPPIVEVAQDAAEGRLALTAAL